MAASPGQDDPIIQLSQLTRYFGATAAVDTLSFTVRRGEVFGLLGHNGAGKTTTIRLLCGVLVPSSGAATVFGLSPLTEGQQIRERCGVLTETPSLEERLSARQNLTYFADLYAVPVNKVKARITELLENFDLAKVADAKVGSFSKGMKQRLALARAFLHMPEVLMLDEPTAGLDPVAARQVTDMIRTQSHESGHTVILCTHNLVEAQQVCNRVAVLERGRLLALGTPTELASALGSRLELELSADTLERALTFLKDNGLTFTVEPPDSVLITGLERERIPDFIVRLIETGVRIYRVSPQGASLEDVYFALHEAKKVTA